MRHGARDADQPGTLPDVPPATPRTIRIDDATWKLATEECQRRGLDSTAEYVRQAVIRCLAVDHMVRVMDSGADPSELADMERLVSLLAQVARRQHE